MRSFKYESMAFTRENRFDFFLICSAAEEVLLDLLHVLLVELVDGRVQSLLLLFQLLMLPVVQSLLVPFNLIASLLVSLVGFTSIKALVKVAPYVRSLFLSHCAFVIVAETRVCSLHSLSFLLKIDY